jgi:hypothetical protein
MANVKITDLTTHTNPVSTDVLPIVDVGTDVTKKISIADLLENAGSGTESAPGIAFDGDSNTGIYRPGADQLAISTNGTGRLFIDNNGRVGIGVTPASVLHVKGPQPSITLEKSAGSFSGLGFKTTGNATSDFVIIANSSGSEFLSNRYVFKNVTATEYMRLDSSGRLGLGTSSPSEQLTVSSTNNTILSVSTGNASAKLAVDNDRAADLIGGQIIGRWDNNDVARIDFYNGADGTNKDDGAIALSTSNGGSNPQERLYVSQSGNVGIGTTSPSSLLHLADAGDITVGTTTGTKIGTATSQKIGFYNATPVVQPTAVADITTTATSGSLPTPDGSVTIADAATPTVTELLKYCVELEAKLEAALGHLRTLGLIAT